MSILRGRGIGSSHKRIDEVSAGKVDFKTAYTDRYKGPFGKIKKLEAVGVPERYCCRLFQKKFNKGKRKQRDSREAVYLGRREVALERNFQSILGNLKNRHEFVY